MAQEYKGKSVYKGIVLGPIAVFKKNDVQVKREKITDAESEIARMQEAVSASQEQLQKLYDKAVKEVGEASAAIFEVHQMMLEDEDYQDGIYHQGDAWGYDWAQRGRSSCYTAGKVIVEPIFIHGPDFDGAKASGI